MFNSRYTYNTSAMADKLHHLYKGDWTKWLPRYFPEEYKELYQAHPTKTEDLKLAVPKYIRLADPNMQFCTMPADDTHGVNIRYQNIPADFLPKKFKKKILDLTVPGLMGKTVQWAKDNQNVSDWKYPYSTFVQKFATPTSEYYHDKFAKDLWKVAARSLKRKELETKEEKYEMLQLWLKANAKLKRPPNVKDHWVVPKGHRLYVYYEQGFKILPAPGTVWRDFNGADQAITMLLPQIKKGIIPNGWGTFRYQYPKEAEEIEKKYPEVLLGHKNKYWQNNLTSVQQKKVDKWNDVLALVKKFPELPMLEWWNKLNKKERYLIGNHAKFLGSKWSLHGKEVKIANWLKPIVEEVNTLRPELRDWYVNKNKHGTLPLRLVQQYEKKQAKLLHLAEAGKPRPTGVLSYSLSSFTRKNSLHVDFANKIKKLRPDWFDEKQLARLRSQRHHRKLKRA